MLTVMLYQEQILCVCRLLNMDVNKWVHLNCALWSYEVYETCNGALMNVDVAHNRGLTTECVVCRKMGATLGCFKGRCTNSYHLPCARSKGCIFFQDKVRLHKALPSGQVNVHGEVTYREMSNQCHQAIRPGRCQISAIRPSGQVDVKSVPSGQVDVKSVPSGQVDVKSVPSGQVDVHGKVTYREMSNQCHQAR